MTHPTDAPSPESRIPQEDRVWLTRGAELHRPLARAAKLGMANGMGYAVFGGLSLLFALSGWDMAGLTIGAVLLGVGLHERAQARRLIDADPAAPGSLARGELTLLAAITLYGLIGLTVMPGANGALQQQLAGAKGLGVDIQQITNSIQTIWYTAVIAIALLYQGLTARYFLNRRSDLNKYLSEIPAWAREVVEAMAKKS